MKNSLSQQPAIGVSSLEELADFADYSFMDSLNSDPEANEHGVDHAPRQVFTGHYVPVKPTPIENVDDIAAPMEPRPKS